MTTYRDRVVAAISAQCGMEGVDPRVQLMIAANPFADQALFHAEQAELPVEQVAADLAPKLGFQLVRCVHGIPACRVCADDVPFASPEAAQAYLKGLLGPTRGERERGQA